MAFLFSTLQWVLLGLILLYLVLWAAGDRWKTAVFCLTAAAVTLEAVAGVFGFLGWLGWPSPMEFVTNSLDSYPGHSMECIRGRAINYGGMEELFPDTYEELCKKYGEPVRCDREERDRPYRIAVYPSFTAEYLILDSGGSLLERVLINGRMERGLPISRVRVGDAKWRTERAYRFNGTAERGGETYFVEDVCMMCDPTKNYWVRFEYGGGGKRPGKVTQIEVYVSWGA